MPLNTRNLPCKLNEEELLTRGQDMATVHRDIVALEEEKKSNAKQFKEKIDRAKVELACLAREVSSKQAWRDIEVREEKSHTGKGWAMETFRMDTGELVATRPLTAEEMQRDLAIVGDLEKQLLEQEKGEERKASKRGKHQDA